MKYVIIDSTEVGIIDFTKVKETSLNTLRYNNDKTLTFVKYEGKKPSFLAARKVYTLAAFKQVLSDETWQNEE
tara:strand:+ start:135 stop:353 length:219 start_codon:yes stop_codon:yes gene_type:complete